MGRIMAVIRKEFIQIGRDRLTLEIIFTMPLIQLILFAYAIQTEVKHIPTTVFDQSLTMESRNMIDAFRNSEYFNIDYAANSYSKHTLAVQTCLGGYRRMFIGDLDLDGCGQNG